MSDRERMVVRLVSSRLTTTEIVGALFVSPNTSSHTSRASIALDVSSRADAVRAGEARGLI